MPRQDTLIGMFANHGNGNGKSLRRDRSKRFANDDDQSRSNSAPEDKPHRRKMRKAAGKTQLVSPIKISKFDIEIEK